MDIKASCNQLREESLLIERKTRELKRHFSNIPPDPDRLIDLGEMLANATLAIRHFEDARMRLGKVIQAFDGGVSVYDSRTTEPVPATSRA
jgi:hypothetical protein